MNIEDLKQQKLNAEKVLEEIKTKIFSLEYLQLRKQMECMPPLQEGMYYTKLYRDNGKVQVEYIKSVTLNDIKEYAEIIVESISVSQYDISTTTCNFFVGDIDHLDRVLKPFKADRKIDYIRHELEIFQRNFNNKFEHIKELADNYGKET